jgi:hypothetical protein
MCIDLLQKNLENTKQIILILVFSILFNSFHAQRNGWGIPIIKIELKSNDYSDSIFTLHKIFMDSIQADIGTTDFHYMFVSQSVDEITFNIITPFQFSILNMYPQEGMRLYLLKEKDFFIVVPEKVIERLNLEYNDIDSDTLFAKDIKKQFTKVDELGERIMIELKYNFIGNKLRYNRYVVPVVKSSGG